MTSSYKATGTASVRQTPISALPTAGAWALNELAIAQPLAQVVVAIPAPSPEVVAAEKARLIDEGYARGLADGERKAAAAAQQRVADALAAVDGVTAQM